MNAIAFTLVDYYVLATAVLVCFEIASWLIRQPALRMTLAWGTA